MKRIALFLFLILSAITCLAQTQIDPTYQIRWNALAYPGAPAANGITCTQNGNYAIYPYGAEWGQSYQDTTNNVEYKCTTSGWVNNLPTTGGTLTGALNGTSASFSGTITAGAVNGTNGNFSGTVAAGTSIAISSGGTGNATGTAQHTLNLPADLAAQSLANPQNAYFTQVGIANNQFYSGLSVGEVFPYGTSEFAGHELPCAFGEPCPGSAPEELGILLGKPIRYTASTWSLTGNVITVQMPNNYRAGQKVILQHFTQGIGPSFSSGGAVVLSAANSTSFSFPRTGSNGGPYTEPDAEAVANFAVSSTGCGDALGWSTTFFNWIPYQPNDVVYWNSAINDIGEAYPNNTSPVTQEQVKGCWRTLLSWVETPQSEIVTGQGGIASGAIVASGTAIANPFTAAPITGSEIALNNGSTITIGGTPSYPLSGTTCSVTMMRQKVNNSYYTITVDGVAKIDPTTGTTSWSSQFLYTPYNATLYPYTVFFDNLAGNVNHEIVITQGSGTNQAVFYWAACSTPGDYAPNVLPRVEVAGLSLVQQAILSPAASGTYTAQQYSDWYQMERDFFADAANRGMNVGYTDLFNNKYMNPATCLQSPTDKHWTLACAAGVAAASLADMSAATIGERNTARNAVMKQRGGIISGVDFIYPAAYGVGRTGDPPYGFTASNIGTILGRHYFGADATRFIDRNGSVWDFENGVGNTDTYNFHGAAQGLALSALVGTGTATFAMGSNTVAGTGSSAFCERVCDSVSGTVGINTGTGITATGTVLTITLPGSYTNAGNCVASSFSNSGTVGAPLPVYASTALAGSVKTLVISSYTNLSPSVSNNNIMYVCGGPATAPPNVL